MLEEVLKIIEKWIREKKVGNITLNLFKGGISSVRLEETIKLPKKD